MADAARSELDDERAERERADSGSRDRATVALVDAKVDGIRELVRAEFANIKEDIRGLASLVTDVLKLGIKADDHEKRLRALEEGPSTLELERRVASLEGEKKEDRDWKRVNLPSLIIAGTVALGGILATLHSFGLI